MGIKFGCQGSTWMLDYDIEADMLDKIMDDIKNGGFKGLDMQVTLLGRYREEPERLKGELEKRGLELAALTLPMAFEGGRESGEEREKADYYINFLKHFPGAIMNVPSRVGPNRDNLVQRQKEIIQGMNELGKRAYENGITTSMHPISYKTSYWRFEEDYKVLLEGLNPKYMGYTPDVGHITFGGMDAVEIFKEYLPLIKHVHFKDASNNCEWRKMGEGDIDFAGCVRVLKDGGYKGWIMVEEETPEAQLKTTETIAEIGKFVRKELYPILE
ncbi:sugar phosphate isomerase/epimerase family protein [Mesobacillus selenatarsenatis]|uniref:Inosose dehydratase n=1 Tax=Mesobacillus selenatarsenatis (strain DSM 18680 / JCM 14380 / FERM P-15431 / SF-1) TaxID=1321606 RepID=A0A0A8XB56_MESS1|nr:TIM barrel protein [Mesobacillus selenatarsenatis]GAM16262.1 inosose dehydratase [Mesobacillus selenatarsenatis SF-1]